MRDRNAAIKCARELNMNKEVESGDQTLIAVVETKKSTK